MRPAYNTGSTTVFFLCPSLPIYYMVFLTRLHFCSGLCEEPLMLNTFLKVLIVSVSCKSLCPPHCDSELINASGL